MKKAIALFCFTAVFSAAAFPIAQGYLPGDIGGVLGMKAGFGLVFALKIFFLADVGIEIFFGGAPHLMGIGIELIYLPAFLDYWVYPNLGVSFLCGGGYREKDGQTISTDTNALLLNFDIGINSPRFVFSDPIESGSGNTLYTAIYGEVGFSIPLWFQFKENDEIVVPESNPLVQNGFWFPNIEIGARIGLW